MSVRTMGFLCAVALVTGGLVAGAQRAAGSVIASVTITSPEAGSSVYGDVNVQAQADGPEEDPPQRIEFFVDHHKKPAAIVDCLVDLAYPSEYCGGQWLWHTSALIGRHSVSARVVLLDGQLSDRSHQVHVVVMGETHLAVHKVKHAVAGHKMAVAGRIRSLAKGHPGARHVPVTVTTAPAIGGGRTLHLRTNKHGYYRKKIRARSNTSITVTPTATRRYQASPQVSYVQYVRGRAHCGLSRRHAAVRHPVILRCHMSHLPYGSKYVLQNRIHGKWRRGRGFTTLRDNHTKLYISGLKRRTLVMREMFPANNIYGRSHSNVVKLHVT
jgi:hypothetical protein